MFADTIDDMSHYAEKKAKLLWSNPSGYFLASMLAGIYVGFGIVLIFSVGAPFYDEGNPALKLVMGASFGIALSLVIFAGSELFTGNTMAMPLGILRKATGWKDLAAVWGVSWLGNLAGAFLLALTVYASGAVAHAYPLFAKYAHIKMEATPFELILKGILCNTLVCLAVWTSQRAKSEAARLIMIFWCLFGFIGSGYEHSVANMSLLALSVLSNGGDTSVANWSGYAYNLFWVTIGNTLAGVFVMALPYYWISRQTRARYKAAESENARRADPSET